MSKNSRGKEDRTLLQLYKGEIQPIYEIIYVYLKDVVKTVMHLIL